MFHIHDKFVKSNKSFVTPSAWVTGGVVEDASPVIASEIIGPGWHVQFASHVELQELVQAVQHSNVTTIGASNASMHSSNFKFFGALSWIVCCSGCNNELLKEMCGSPFNELVEKFSVDFSGDECVFFQAIKCVSSSQVPKSTQHQQFHWRFSSAFFLCHFLKQSESFTI